MKKEVIFYYCEHCKNMELSVNDSGVNPVCCGEKMKKLTANTTDGAKEKHVPVVKRNGNMVEVVVGEVDHPMLAEHYIQWIYLETENGGQIRYLAPGDKPAATFCVECDAPVAVYEYCNLHGLWKADVK